MIQEIQQKKPESSDNSSKFELVAFDLDGTLIELNIPFDEIRRELGIKGRFILESIMEESDMQRRQEMFRILESYELKCAMEARPAYYAVELVNGLDVIKGVITRNSRRSAEIVAERLGFNFDFIIGREDAKPKPSPEPLILALKMFDVKPSRALMVGDFLFDILSGKAAGAKAALILTERNKEMAKSFIQHADYVFESLKELADFLEVR
ncbi:MAG: HAD family hydrolase [Archaeoglobus sp.]|uniref:HAD family hydrolase n=1 Tax=Archaeoglobus sp. TaxID=1872626 RepID=UPI001D6D86EF|nr:HAD family hydrolase [Archaeoglobus sp.]MBO8179030.1 HAD family hydrolase [Archaeoglobus sp.]